MKKDNKENKDNNNKKYYIFKMNMTVLNIFSFVLLGIVIGIGILIYKDFWKEYTDNFFKMGLFLVAFFGYMILHELLHGLSYRLHGAKGKNITFGIHLEKNILCCLCKQDITKKNILISLLYPFFFIGIVIYVIGAIFKLPMLFLLSIFNLSGCIGDIVMFIFISRLPKDIKFSEFDDPTSFAILSSEDLSNRKPFGLNFDRVDVALPKNDMKKLRVSKKSILFMIFLIIMTIFMLIMASAIGK